MDGPTFHRPASRGVASDPVRESEPASEPPLPASLGGARVKPAAACRALAWAARCKAPAVMAACEKAALERAPDTAAEAVQPPAAITAASGRRWAAGPQGEWTNWSMLRATWAARRDGMPPRSCSSLASPTRCTMDSEMPTAT